MPGSAGCRPKQCRSWYRCGCRIARSSRRRRNGPSVSSGLTTHEGRLETAAGDEPAVALDVANGDAVDKTDGMHAATMVTPVPTPRMASASRRVSTRPIGRSSSSISTGLGIPMGQFSVRACRASLTSDPERKLGRDCESRLQKRAEQPLVHRHRVAIGHTCHVVDDLGGQVCIAVAVASWAARRGGRGGSRPTA